MDTFLKEAASAVEQQSLSDLKGKMQAMHNALQSGKEHLAKSEETCKSRGSVSRASSAGAPAIKSDEDLCRILGGPSASADDKNRGLEMLEAVSSRFRT
eukprot:9502838-Pyramimonas_sp.AAC.2